MKTCINCGKELPSNRRKYCCDRCRGRAKYWLKRGKNVPLRRTHCVVCGKKLKKRRMKYCSRECQREWERQNPSMIPCPNCGKPIYKSSSQCSSCYMKDRMSDPEERRKVGDRVRQFHKEGRYKEAVEKRRIHPKAFCTDCGAEVSAPHVTRCLACYYKAVALPLNFCVDCGTEIYNQRYKLSTRCYSCSAKHMWRTGVMDGIFQSPTKPERKVQAALRFLEIPFDFQWRPSTWHRVFDFRLWGTVPILIEVQGDYWHGNPELYEDHELNETQRKRHKSDREKREWCKANGYILVELWEREIKARTALVLIQERIIPLLSDYPLRVAPRQLQLPLLTGPDQQPDRPEH